MATFNNWMSYEHSENVYQHNVPTQIKYRNRFNELESKIKNSKDEHFKIKGGKNITLTTEGQDKNKSIVINVELSKSYNEKSRHVDDENTPKKGESLDEVTKKLFNAISENGDTIDGERIKLDGTPSGFMM